MKMPRSLGLFLFLLLMGTMLAPTRRPEARGHGTWHVGQSSFPQAESSSASLEQSGGARAKVAAAYGKLPLRFEANQGQADLRVKFLSQGSGYTVFLTSTEAVLALQNPSLTTAVQKHPGNAHGNRGTSATVLRMKIGGANRSARMEGLELLPGKSHYFIGNDPAKWHTNVSTYAKVRFEGVYPGVDLVYYGNQGQLEYDFVIAPGANPRAIRMSFGGFVRARHAVPLQVDVEGNLILRISGGEVQFHKPVVYQQVGETRQDIAARYLIRSNHQIGFEVAAYDGSKPLIIDPVLSYSTYLGGSADDIGNAIAVDSSGNAYVTGSTLSTNFPTKSPLQAASGGGQDAFVAKLDPTGSSLVYSTFLGGSGNDFPNGIAVDGSGNAYVTGLTDSANFPTKNPLQAALGSTSNDDAFVAKLDPSGSSLVYSTFLGGSGNDFASGIAVDGSGNAYVTGSTLSTNFPTASPFQATCGACSSGQSNAFVSKLNPAGASLVYSTFLGGSNGDSGNAIAVDASGNAYVTGSTVSTNFPTKNPLQSALGGGNDVFVVKVDPTGSSLVYSTFLGGSGNDFANGVAVDGSGNAYVTGSTLSTNFPTASPFQAACGACSTGQPNAFVSKLNTAGSALVYSTYLGGNGNGSEGDFGNSIAVDTSNNAYITGFTSSQNFPLASPIQGSLVPETCTFEYYGYTYTVPCSNTAFVTMINPAGSALLYSTYLGASGGNLENGAGIAVDAAGNAYVTGRATSNFLLTPGSLQTSPGGNSDAFVAKISPNDAPGFSLSSFSLSFQDEGIGGTTTPQVITLANTGSATLTIASIVLGGGDFAQTNTCGSSLTGGTSCTISVTFTPTAAGVRTGKITMTDNTGTSPQTATLTGKGVAGLAATLSPTALTFGNQTEGTISAPQGVTFTNTGSAALIINGFSFGGTNPSDFTLSSASCNQNQSLAVGASCVFDIAFAPLAVGNRAATLQIVDNSAQSPRNVSLTGVGLAPPTVALSPTSLAFAAQIVGSASSAQSVTLTTSGSGTLAISSISATIDDFKPTNNCGTSVAGGASCTITVTFTPTAVGNRAGTLVIADNATDSPQMLPLLGLGTDFSISPAVGSITSVTVNAGQPATYTVSAVGTSGFSGTVSLSCSDPARQSSCSFSPNPLMVSGTTAQTATVTVTTVARSALPPHWRPPIFPPGLRVALPWLLLLASLVLLTMALRRRSRQRRVWVGLAAMLIAAALFFGCGRGGAPPPSQGTLAGTYQILVNATSAGVTRTTTLSLTVR
jgi:beta-propeller repeat-containing protein/ASPM-SPD-2-Hydin domain-containing protein